MTVILDEVVVPPRRSRELRAMTGRAAAAVLRLTSDDPPSITVRRVVIGDPVNVGVDGAPLSFWLDRGTRHRTAPGREVIVEVFNNDDAPHRVSGELAE